MEEEGGNGVEGMKELFQEKSFTVVLYKRIN